MTISSNENMPSNQILCKIILLRLLLMKLEIQQNTDAIIKENMRRKRKRIWKSGYYDEISLVCRIYWRENYLLKNH